MGGFLCSFMKKLPFLLMFFACSTVRTQVITFSKAFSNFPLNAESAIQVKEWNNHYILLSFSECIGQNSQCCMTSKINAQGDIIWFKQYPFWQSSFSMEIYDGRIYVSGHVNHETDSQLVLYCLDMEGEVLWQREYGDHAKDEEFPRLLFANDSLLFLYGARHRDINGMPRALLYLLKTNLQGDSLAEYTYGWENHANLAVNTAKTPSGQLLLSHGLCVGACGFDRQAGLTSVDLDGDANWVKEFPFTFLPGGSCHVALSDTNSIAVMWYSDTIAPSYDPTAPTVYYLDTLGQGLGKYVFLNQTAKDAHDISSAPGAAIVGCGQDYYVDYNLDPAGQAALGGWVFKIGADRELQWDRTYTDTTDNGIQFYLFNINPTSDGGYIAVGRLGNSMTGVVEGHNWVLKLDSAGCLVPGCGAFNYIVGAEEAVFLKGQGIRLWPNPTSGPLEVEVPEALCGQRGSLATLWSAAGARVRSWPGAFSGHGRYDLGDLPAGVYYLVFSIGNEVVGSLRVMKG
jgi:hypothetical protein